MIQAVTTTKSYDKPYSCQCRVLCPQKPLSRYIMKNAPVKRFILYCAIYSCFCCFHYFLQYQIHIDLLVLWEILILFTLQSCTKLCAENWQTKTFLNIIKYDKCHIQIRKLLVKTEYFPILN